MPNSIHPAWCFVVPWSLSNTEGGVNQVVRNLIREFENNPDYKWRPIVLETDWGLMRPESSVSNTKVLHISPHSPMENNRPIWGGLSFFAHLPGELLRLSRLAKQCGIEVFNLHYVDGVALNFVLLRRLGLFRGRVVLSFHGTDIRTACQMKGLARYCFTKILRWADSIVACSNGLAEEVRMLESEARVVTVHNGIDVDQFASSAHADFKWPPNLRQRKVIIQVGSFIYGKGHDLAVKAFKNVQEKHADTSLVLVGKPGAASNQIRQTVNELGLEDLVHILENVPHHQMFDLLANSSVFSFSSRWKKGLVGEGFAVSLLEAGAAGLPVVATACCGVPELIIDGETGRLVPLEDSESLAQGICEMLENPNFAARVARNLHELVRTQFTWKRAAASYATLDFEKRSACCAEKYSI